MVVVVRCESECVVLTEMVMMGGVSEDENERKRR